MSIGEHLKEIRKQKKITLKELSKMTDYKYSYSYLSQIENGVNGKKPSPEMLKILSEKLDTSYYELMSIAGYLDNRSADEIVDDLEKTMAKYKIDDYLIKGAIAKTKAALLDEFKEAFFEELKYVFDKDEIENKTEEFSSILKKLALFNTFELEEVFSSNSTTYFEEKELTDEQKEKILNVIKAIL